MRYIKYTKYFVQFLVINIVLILITWLKMKNEGICGAFVNTAFVQDFIYGFLLSISTGLIVYISTAIHTEKIELYKNENDILAIHSNLQNFRNTISEMKNNRKDLEPENVLKELTDIRDYCNKILSLFYLAGLENSRSGKCENICANILYKGKLQHIIDAEQIWRNIAFSVNMIYQQKNFDSNIVVNGMIMETVNRLDYYLHKHMQLLSVYTSAILYTKKAFPSKRFIYKYIKRTPFFNELLKCRRFEKYILFEEAFQKMLNESKKLSVEIERRLDYSEARMTFRYILTNESMYVQLLEKYSGKENRKMGYNLYCFYSSLEEKKVLYTCVDDLLQNEYIEEKEIGTQQIFYITDKGKKLLKKCKKLRENGEKIRIDLRTSKQIKSGKEFAYEIIEQAHIILSDS